MTDISFEKFRAGMNFGFILKGFLGLLILMFILFAVGLLIDYWKRDRYKVQRIYYRKTSYSVVGQEEYYFNYWLWQPKKKAYFSRVLENQGVTTIYSRHARKRRFQKCLKIPFRREIYGINKEGHSDLEK
ncbi:hypothetical protein [Listeria fleischmannii]|uniref:Uncharacterized protein n=1 Tax=Listeria fleischmannii FSL S10-1203 TaxID=1265822 RepID=W7DS91_9LIST|nr:hypothetical protein [Listeria fleischmannii]EUJ53537.1 hypothetical protein MCOL2_11095 [Listeria fleischmannii FSL S10-1203]